MATIVGGKGTFMLACHDASGKMSRVEIGRPEPGPDDVKIDLKYCGMCHSDLHTVDGSWGVNKYPIAVGHELAGVVTAVSETPRIYDTIRKSPTASSHLSQQVGANAAAKFSVGQNVAVGCMVMSCMTCGLCDQGLEQHCPKMAQTYSSPFPQGCGHDECSGTWTNGGYSTGITVTTKTKVKLKQSSKAIFGIFVESKQLSNRFVSGSDSCCRTGAQPLLLHGSRGHAPGACWTPVLRWHHHIFAACAPRKGQDRAGGGRRGLRWARSHGCEDRQGHGRERDRLQPYRRQEGRGAPSIRLTHRAPLCLKKQQSKQ